MGASRCADPEFLVDRLVRGSRTFSGIEVLSISVIGISNVLRMPLVTPTTDWADV